MKGGRKHYSASRSNPRPLGRCMRCQFIYNRDQLKMQEDYRGDRLEQTGMIVCPTCYDAPQHQNRPIFIKPDPEPVVDPLPDDGQH